MFTVEVQSNKIKQVSVFTCCRKKTCSVFLNTTSVLRRCPLSCWLCTSFQCKERRTSFKFYQRLIWSTRRLRINLCSSLVRSLNPRFIFYRMSTVRLSLEFFHRQNKNAYYYNLVYFCCEFYLLVWK
jgi:hypothetical protein